MKQFLLSGIAILLASTSFGQITLEHTYPNGEWKTSMINLSQVGYKYAYIDDIQGEIKLYNLDHSIYKTMIFPVLSDMTGVYVFYISDKLFNLDNNIEYMVFYQNDGNWINSKTVIYSEDGQTLFSKDGETPAVGNSYSEYQGIGAGIFITPLGSKMILDNHNDSSSNIYNLPGSLPTALSDANKNKYDFNLYPNPASDYIKINYTLPSNVKIAQVSVYDINGKIVKTYNVDNSFNDILIETSDLSSGTYICKISSDKQKLSETKFIVTK